MTEHPILFNEPMSTAARSGQKSQTRRVAIPKRSYIDFIGGGPKGGPDWNDPSCWGFEDLNTGIWWALHGNEECRQIPCPYGNVGDRLWVRETYVAFGRWETRFSVKKGRDEWHFVDLTLETGREYRFGGDLPNAKRGSATPAWWRRPSIFMPRAASRTLLEVTGVRVERLQGISEADARTEGVTIEDRHTVGYCAGEHLPPSIRAFRELWDGLNAEAGHGWDTNPWLWVIEFRRIEK
ncbi:hypothetical protein [Burkholderia cenocepacia]|uniref:hypothetical protein n=1 Tax=Burkholderia cenocepacia TaxID=95486 RepID=UPI0013DF107A|nr:hypothetical protein [Burkholderia cenocepacia]MCW3583979.1 hypothetical protein [Burkholderia cenocepacia]MCW3629582.1 hypothetical protein [Burkholderia cenocepacia]MCW5182610.1 hypothetical protein [Burkholderia cenocepacia]NGO98949.1 hypothetical protein [Burkholderia cenocepacia]